MWLRVHENMYNLDNIRSMIFNYKNHCDDPEESNVNSVCIEFNNGESTVRYFKNMHELFNKVFKLSWYYNKCYFLPIIRYCGSFNYIRLVYLFNT